MDYLTVLAVISGLLLPTLGALIMAVFVLRRDILRTLERENGIIDYGTPKPARAKPLVKKAPRVIDDETAYRIEQEQAQRNARDYS